MDRTELVYLRTRLEMAGRLVESCSDALVDWRPAQLGEEIVRREIELVARGLMSCVVAITERLVSVRLRLRPADCPHCAWPIAPYGVERCPRCNGPREVRDEIPGPSSRRAS